MSMRFYHVHLAGSQATRLRHSPSNASPPPRQEHGCYPIAIAADICCVSNDDFAVMGQTNRFEFIVTR